MRQQHLEVVETLVDDYSGRQIGTYEGTTMGWTIIRNSDGLIRHVEDLTKGALNVLAEAFDGLADSGGREAAYRSAVGTLQKMLESELQAAEEDDASALLLAQQADMIAAEAEINAEANATSVADRIGEYTNPTFEGPTFAPGDAVLITAPGHSQIDGREGTVFSKCSADSEFDYLVSCADGTTHGRTVVVYSYELTPLVYPV